MKSSLLIALCAVLPGAAVVAATPSVVQDDAAAITLILPASEGSSGDRLGHIVATALAGALNMPVRIERIPGQSGVVGSNAIAAAPADGRVIGLGFSTPMIGAKLMSPAAAYNPIESFDWLALLATYGNAMIVRDDNPSRTLNEWLDVARATQRPLRYGAVGVASAAQLAGEFLRVDQRANIVHQSFEGNRQAYAALASGEVDVLFGGVPTARTMAVPGKFRVLAVTSARRHPQMPDVPAFGEVWPGRHFDLWVGIIAPIHLPADTRSRLAAGLGVMLADKTFAAQLRDAGATWIGLAGADASEFVKDDILRKAKQIAELRIRRDDTTRGAMPPR